LNHNIKSGKIKVAALNNKLTKDNPLSKYLQKPKWSKKELKEKYEDILSQNNSNIDLHLFKEDSPLVSIIILNRNGKNHLSRLFSNFKENIHYPNYELIVVDQDSGDGSVAFLESLSSSLPLKIIKIKKINPSPRPIIRWWGRPRVITLQTSSIGFKSGEYSGKYIKFIFKISATFLTSTAL